jgi:hypothetical protein
MSYVDVLHAVRILQRHGLSDENGIDNETIKKAVTLDIATKLYSSYLQGERALNLSNKPEHWAEMAKKLVSAVIT